ncbi:MAG TPA: hypothetical protein VL284_06710 [Thermoanaerobaculia bacterium]|nr:hypothetical protein [Thermoanaerobaculia bacterium]
MNDDCLRFAEDPETNAAHLRACETCRAAYGSVETKAIALEALPLAPWEGASYRAWPVVLIGVLAVLGVALGLCAAAGISPMGALTIASEMQFARASAVYQRLRPFGPAAFTVAFIVVNSLLFLLLRRAPRGIDA